MPKSHELASRFERQVADFAARNRRFGIRFNPGVGTYIKDALKLNVQNPDPEWDELDGFGEVRAIKGGGLWLATSSHEFDDNPEIEVFYGVFDTVASVLPTPWALARVYGPAQRVRQAIDFIEGFLQKAR